MPEPQQGRQGTLSEGRDHGRRPRQVAGPAVREWDSGIGRRLELLQDETQRLLEQVCHEFGLERRPQDRAGTEHAQRFCRELYPCMISGMISLGDPDWIREGE